MTFACIRFLKEPARSCGTSSAGHWSINVLHRLLALAVLLALSSPHVRASEATPNTPLAADFPASATPNRPPITMPTFDVCVDKLLADAEALGVSATTRKRARDIIREDRSVLTLDQSQPEFTNTFAG